MFLDRNARRSKMQAVRVTGRRRHHKMRIVRKNTLQEAPELSFVLLDWGCRESFHTLEYLSNQIIAREKYEVIWVEYYDRQLSELADLIERYERHGLSSPIDTWIVLARPKGEIFRKHWMNNIGLLHSRGGIVVFMDSDAITSTTVVDTFFKEFENDPDVILYLEEIRTGDQSFYPFGYPNPKEIIPVASNLINGVPVGMRNFRSGLLADPSLIHCRNYGACFAARREDIIRVGGWDEHDDYSGYIAGPYEMSMRMEWIGKRERWNFGELLWHVPHPGNNGIDNFSGPHDGKGVSTTAMKILETRRTLPLVENPEIRALRETMFGPEAPMPVAKRPKSPPEREPTPTTPERSGHQYVPSYSRSLWNKDTFFLLSKMLQNIETRACGYEYPRAYVVGAYAAALAKQLNLPQDRTEAVYVAGAFGSADNIVRLGAAQADGNGSCGTVAQTLADLWDREPLLTVAKVGLMQREHFDGTGPMGVRSENIPLEARIVALAERLDELVNLRDGGNATIFHEAYRSILADSGKRFDPQIVDAFKECLEDMVCIHLRAQHDALPFMYPCFKYQPQAGSAQQQCGQFSIATVEVDRRTKYFAVPAWETSAPLIFSSYDLDQVTAYATPELLFCYHGFNIIACANRYFAIAHGELELDLVRFYEGDYNGRCFVSDSLRRVKRAALWVRLKQRLRGLMLWPARKVVRALVSSGKTTD